MPSQVPVDWNIKNLDTGELLNPPYPMGEDGVRMTVGGNVVKQDRFGFQNPISQWVSGKVRTITFSAVLFTKDSTDSIVAKFKEFVALGEPDDRWGRPPICVFNLGSFLSEMVMVEGVDPDIPPVRPTIAGGTGGGEPRQVTLNITMSRYVPFSQVQIDPSKPTKESYYLVVTRPEASYEAIARRYYGNPLLGDRLRKRNPAEPMMPSVGSKISVPARAVILSEVVEPAFHVLKVTDEDSMARVQEIVDARSAREVVFI